MFFLHRLQGVRGGLHHHGPDQRHHGLLQRSSLQTLLPLARLHAELPAVCICLSVSLASPISPLHHINILFVSSLHPGQESRLSPTLILRGPISAWTLWRSSAPGILPCGVWTRSRTTAWWTSRPARGPTRVSKTSSPRACLRPRRTSSASSRSRTSSTGTSTKGPAAVCV